MSDSNQRPADYKSAALPAELKWLFVQQLSKTFGVNTGIHPHFWEGKGKGKHETEKFFTRKKNTVFDTKK